MIFLIVYSYFWPMGLPLAANMAGMIELLFTTPVFWLCLILVPFTTLIPDIAYKVSVVDLEFVLLLFAASSKPV